MEQKLTFMTNQKWKDYEDDPKIKALFKTLEKQRKQREKDFQEWLSTDISYDGEEPIYIHNIILSMMEEISMMADGNKPTVNKRLRDMIASTLYKESKYESGFDEEIITPKNI